MTDYQTQLADQFDIPNPQPPAPAFGQVWKLGARLALVRRVAPHPEHDAAPAHLAEVRNGCGTDEYFTADIRDGRIVTSRGTWSLVNELPRLRCADTDAAAAAAEYLRSKGIHHDVMVDGDQVAAPLDPRSVITFAEEAVERGWSDDGEAARMIGRLS